MKVSSNSYYHWLNQREVGRSVKPTELLKGRIKAIFDESKQVYGSTRVQKVLEKEGVNYCRSYIGLLMKEMGLRSVLSKKFKVMTTDSNHPYAVAENVLRRDFNSNILGEKWVSDITYIKVGIKWHYLTTIMDLADRKIISWTLSDDMTTENTVYKAWLQATKIRPIAAQHIFHSDRGVQYAAWKMASLFDKNEQITPSMSRKGNCWDNAVAESFFKTLKHECTNRYVFHTKIQAYQIIKEYIHWYNYKRIHSSIGYKTPAERELEIRLENYQKTD